MRRHALLSWRRRPSFPLTASFCHFQAIFSPPQPVGMAIMGKGRVRGSGRSPAQDSVVEKNAVMAMEEEAVAVRGRVRPRGSGMGVGKGGGRFPAVASHEEESVALRSRGRPRRRGRSGMRGRGRCPAAGSQEDDGATPIEVDNPNCPSVVRKM